MIPAENLPRFGAPSRACESCGQTITDDPSGLCLACQPGYASEAPGSATDAQCSEAAAMLFDMSGETGKWASLENLRGLLSEGIGREFGPTETLHGLSQREAGDLLEHLYKQRLPERPGRHAGPLLTADAAPRKLYRARHRKPVS